MLLCVVEEGSHEDRRIVGVYTTKELADKAKEIIATENEIVVFDADLLPDTSSCPPGRLPWEVYMNKAGGARNARIVRRVSVVDFEEIDFLKELPTEGREHIFRVFASDRDEAIKLADKFRENLLIANCWKAF